MKFFKPTPTEFNSPLIQFIKLYILYQSNAIINSCAIFMILICIEDIITRSSRYALILKTLVLYYIIFTLRSAINIVVIVLVFNINNYLALKTSLILSMITSTVLLVLMFSKVFFNVVLGLQLFLYFGLVICIVVLLGYSFDGEDWMVLGVFWVVTFVTEIINIRFVKKNI